MAEAIKTTKTEKIKPSTSEKNHARSEEEITDKSLESRLKSLTSFINNIEPTPKAEVSVSFFFKRSETFINPR